MASACSHNNDGIPLATLLEWYKIRDTFFGRNEVFPNIPLALELASSCQHPDARWLSEACGGKDVNTEEDAKRVFSAFGQKDAGALCFAWLCSTSAGQNDLAPLRRSAKLGFAFAQFWMAWRSEGVGRFKFAQLAAAQGERDGLFILGRCFRDGHGCEKDLDKANKTKLFVCERTWSCVGDDLVWKLAIQGRSTTMAVVGPGGSSRRQLWNFVFHFAKEVELFYSGSGSVAVMFVIGRALHGHVDEQARTFFNGNYKFGSRIGPAKQAIAFYETQIQATKAAVRTWTLIGLRYNVVKDVRNLIAKLIYLGFTRRSLVQGVSLDD